MIYINMNIQLLTASLCTKVNLFLINGEFNP